MYLPGEDLGVRFVSQCVLDIGLSPDLAEERDAAAAAGTADFGCDSTVGLCDFDKMIHVRGCNMRREPLSLRITET